MNAMMIPAAMSVPEAMFSQEIRRTLAVMPSAGQRAIALVPPLAA